LGNLIEPLKSDIPFHDESDRIFYDTAVTSGAVLVTGNIRHFPDEPFVLTPTDFILGYLDF
jgi:predicted nucleic acid-binding protein